MIKTTTIQKVTTDEKNGMIYLEADDNTMTFSLYDSHSKSLFEHVVNKLMEFTGAKSLKELSGKAIRVFGDISLFDKTFCLRAYGHATEDRFVYLDIILGYTDMTHKQLEKWNVILRSNITSDSQNSFSSRIIIDSSLQ